MQKLHIQLLFVLVLMPYLRLQKLVCFGDLVEEHNVLSYLKEAFVYGDEGAYQAYYRGAFDDGEELRSVYDPESNIMMSTDRVFDVDDFGARGDGKTDNRMAFENAWKEACRSSASATILVPAKKSYLLKPVSFSGPCKSNVVLQIEGTIIASPNRSDWKSDRRHWILLKGINNLVVGGGGTINGNGEMWWDHSCKRDKSLPCEDAPTAMTFQNCNNLRVANLHSLNSQQIHISFDGCSGVQASRLTITAPGNSPNTDGIHVTGTTNITIDSCVIKTGDDCISIVSGSKSVKATNTVCGPGHGISIGSLGAHNQKAQVSDVNIDTARLDGTTNGARIKTWQGGSGFAKSIVFQNINMNNVENPIIIDQFYCDRNGGSCSESASAVAVSNVMYRNIKGTSASKVAIKLDCSASVPCNQIGFEDVNLVQKNKAPATSTCKNVGKYTKKGTVIPAPCTSS